MASTAPAEQAISNQDASPLFKIPLELRRTIYANLVDFSAQHIHSAAGSDGISRLRLTPCISPGASNHDGLDGSERCPDQRIPGQKYPIVGPIFRRRLLSSWGPHWMCEELAFHPRDCGEDLLQAASSFPSNASSLFRVCKRMFMEVIDDVAAMADFHVADLQTLRLLLEDSGPPGTPFSLQALDRSRITKLSITLSQPLQFFQAMSQICKTPRQEQGHASNPCSNSEYNPERGNGDIGLWVCLPSLLPTHLPGLRRLLVWLDHTGGNYWSTVDERSILAPVEALGTTNSQLELVCVLPRVHPRIEDNQRHYLPGDAGREGRTPTQHKLEIHRVLRQRYRVFKNIFSNTSIAGGRVQYVEDFPHLHGLNLFTGLSPAEREQFEADGWRGGVNVIRLSETGRRGRFSRLPRFMEPW